MNTNNISIFLDVALSLTFFYFITSMFVSSIVELINTFLEKRSKFLWNAIGKLLEGQLSAFQDHPLIKNFDDKVWLSANVPTSYISASTFVSVVLGLLKSKAEVEPPAKKNDAIAQANDELNYLKILIAGQEGNLKTILETIHSQSKSLKDFEKRLEDWFNQYMEQVSGWFKRHTRLMVWIISIIVAFAMNLNSITITTKLFQDPILRESMVAQAENAAKSQKMDSTGFSYLDKNSQEFMEYVAARKDTSLVNSTKKPKALRKTVADSITITLKKTADTIIIKQLYTRFLYSKIEELKLPIGWKTGANEPNYFKQFGKELSPLSFLGWLLTSFALSFGAPFWFDILIKLVNVRNVMKKPDAKTN